MKVPLSSTRDEVPEGDYEIAWRYLLPDARLTRLATNLDVSITRVGIRTVEADFTLPMLPEHNGTWYVPLVLLSKDPVAPDLEVCDATGATIAIPTKQQNMALTMKALEALVNAGHLELDSDRGRALARDVISADIVAAHIASLILTDQQPSPSANAIELLEELADQFVLWVPVNGASGTHHHCRVCRHEIREIDPIVSPARSRKTIQVPVHTGIGEVQVGFKPLSRWYKVRPKAAMRRLLNAFALRAIEFRATENAARLCASYHLRIHSPEGFLVRNVRASALGPDVSESDASAGEIQTGPFAAVQGEHSDVAHVHLSETDNPPGIYVRVTLGLRGGMTSLWMIAAVLTAVLLWLVHHHVSYGPPAEQNRQIAAGVLLVVPAFASAYSLRSEGNELLRTVLSGARGLLLASAALSVASALALAGLTPSEVSRHDAIEVYAAASYFVAVPLVVAWVLSGRATWLMFRRFLSSQRSNLVVEMGIGVVLVAVGGLADALPVRLSGGVLFICGLGLAALAANSAGEPLRRLGASYRLIAGLGSVAALAVAGFFLGFFDGESVRASAYAACWLTGIAVAMAALAVMIHEASPLPEQGDPAIRANSSRSEV